MNYSKHVIYFPGGEHEVGSTGSPDNKDPKDSPVPLTETGTKASNEDKPIIEKIREALQDWSDKDEADQEFDDTRV